MGRSRNYCSVDGCNNQRCSTVEMSFFKLPVDDVRRQEWLKLIGRPDLLSLPDLKHNSYLVCSDHFSKCMMITIRQLRPNAIPVKNLPNSDPLAGISPGSSAASASPPHQPPPNTKCTIEVGTQTKFKAASSLIKQRMTQTNRKLKEQLATSEKKRRRLEIQLEKVKQEVQSAAPAPGDELMARLYKLIEWQNNAKQQHKGNRFAPEFKLFALALHARSPAQYHSLRAHLALPSASTLGRLRLHLPPHVDDRLFFCLHSKLQALPDTALYCILCLGEVKLRPRLYYETKRDEIIGLHNINGEASSKIATTAYVAVLRGITVEWSQIIAYSFSAAGSEYLNDLDTWVAQIILKLSKLNISVVAIVSDQSANLNNYAKKKRNITIEEPYFLLDSKKIYYIFDIPSLRRHLKGNLLTNDLHYDDKTVSWQHVRTLYSHQKENNLRFVSEALSGPQRQPVTLSSELAAALRVYLHAGLLPAAATATVEFVQIITDALGILYCTRRRSARKGLSLEDRQLQALEAAQDALQGVVATDSATGADTSERIETFENIQISIQAAIMLNDELSKSLDRSVATRQLSIAPLIAFTAQLRREAVRARPSPLQFVRAFCRRFVHDMARAGVGWHPDVCDLLLRPTLTAPPAISAPISAAALGSDVDHRLEIPTTAPLMYAAAFLLYKCAERHPCKQLAGWLGDLPSLNDTPQWSHYRRYNKKAAFYKSLKRPPEELVQYLRAADRVLADALCEHSSLHPAGAALAALRALPLVLRPCSCFPTDLMLKHFVRLRLFTIITHNNKHLVDNKTLVSCQLRVTQLED